MAQNIFHAAVRDSITGENLAGATAVLKGTSIGNTADAKGIIIITDIPDGKTVIVFSLLGYRKKDMEIIFPLSNPEKVFEIKLAAEETQMEEVIISSTRINSRIEEAPLRTEVLGSEEMDEESSV